MKQLFAAACLALLLNGSPFVVSTANAETPEQLVESFHEQLLTTMRQAETLGFSGRYEKLAPVITKAFHLPVMIQMASGSHWEDASENQRDRLITAFSKLSTTTYATRFSGYSGQSFKTIGRRNGPQKTILVRTKIINPDGKDVELGYLTRKIKGDWRIIDVLLDGRYSELARRISEYQGILGKSGVDGLITSLGTIARDMAAAK